MSVGELTILEHWLLGICNDRIKPPPLCRIEKWELPDAGGHPEPILKVDIPRSLYVHESPNGHFHRVGSSKRKMSTDYIVRLVQQRSQTRLIRFDEQPVVRRPWRCSILPSTSGFEQVVRATKDWNFSKSSDWFAWTTRVFLILLWPAS